MKTLNIKNKQTIYLNTHLCVSYQPFGKFKGQVKSKNTDINVCSINFQGDTPELLIEKLLINLIFVIARAKCNNYLLNDNEFEKEYNRLKKIFL